MSLEFSGTIWHWRGPAPWHWVTVPPKESQDLKDILKFVTYGWGMVPVRAGIGKTEWETSLFPKDGSYIVPIKASVQKAERIKIGDVVTVRLVILYQDRP